MPLCSFRESCFLYTEVCKCEIMRRILLVKGLFFILVCACCKSNSDFVPKIGTLIYKKESSAYDVKNDLNWLHSNADAFMFLDNENQILFYAKNNTKQLKAVKIDSIFQLNSNVYGNVLSSILCGVDSLLIIQQYRIVCLDLVSKKYSYQEINRSMQSNYMLYNLNLWFPPFWDKVSNKVYLERIFEGCEDDGHNCNDVSIEGVVDFKTGQIDTAHFCIPHDVNVYLNYSGFISRCVSNDSKQVFSFATSGDLYVYDAVTKSTQQFKCKSKYHSSYVYPNENSFGSRNDYLMHIIDYAPLYNPIMYDKYRNCYYRIFLAAQPKKDKQGYYNTSSSKAMYLQVIGADFSVKNEIRLDMPNVTKYIIINSDGPALYNCKSFKDEVKFYQLYMSS
jgi:hypothetical protein